MCSCFFIRCSSFVHLSRVTSLLPGAVISGCDSAPWCIYHWLRLCSLVHLRGSRLCNLVHLSRVTSLLHGAFIALEESPHWQCDGLAFCWLTGLYTNQIVNRVRLLASADALISRLMHFAIHVCSRSRGTGCMKILSVTLGNYRIHHVGITGNKRFVPIY